MTDDDLSYDDEASPASAVVRWRDVDARDDVDLDLVWAELADFVDWLIGRYDLPRGQIPDCWYRHGALVEELSALHSAYNAAFDDLDSGYGPIGFQERLAQARSRFREYYDGSCTTEHVEKTMRPRRDVRIDFGKWVATGAHAHVEANVVTG